MKLFKTKKTLKLDGKICLEIAKEKFQPQGEMIDTQLQIITDYLNEGKLLKRVRQYHKDSSQDNRNAMQTEFEFYKGRILNYVNKVLGKNDDWINPLIDGMAKELAKESSSYPTIDKYYDRLKITLSDASADRKTDLFNSYVNTSGYREEVITFKPCTIL